MKGTEEFSKMEQTIEPQGIDARDKTLKLITYMIQLGFACETPLRPESPAMPCFLGLEFSGLVML